MNKVSNIDVAEENLEIDQTEKGWLIIQLIGTWVLLNNNFVPISLTVQSELVKFWQAMFMQYEIDMAFGQCLVDKSEKNPSKSTINEGGSLGLKEETSLDN
jgi:hypothetical protein